MRQKIKWACHSQGRTYHKEGRLAKADAAPFPGIGERAGAGPLVPQGWAGSDEPVRQRRVGEQIQYQGQGGPEQIGRRHPAQFFGQEPPKIEPGIKDLMKEKAGNEDKQDSAGGEDVGQHPFRVGGEGLAAQAIAVVGDYKDNGDTAIAGKGGEKHWGRRVEG